MLNNHRRFKPGRLPLRSYKETWVKNKRKNSPEFARWWQSDSELAVKGQSVQAMHW
jgi:hypothetical protein